jgi:integrase
VRNEKGWLDSDQIKIFIEAIKGQPCEIPALLALSSLRRSEIFGLKWDDIDFKNKTIHVNGAIVFNADQKLVYKPTNKNSSSNRVIPIMIPELLAALQKNKKQNGPVVTCFPNTLCSQINRVCAANNLPQVGVHGLRHSFASLGYHLGMNEMEVMRIGGWSDFDTMRKIYTHLAEADKQKAENKMAAFYKNANKKR